MAKKNGIAMAVVTAKTTFTLAEAAALLCCHAETLRRAIRGGELRAARLGRGYRISRIDLEAFWTACGGGELFAAQPTEQRDETTPDGMKRKKRPRQKEGMDQLPLLPDTPER